MRDPLRKTKEHATRRRNIDLGDRRGIDEKVGHDMAPSFCDRHDASKAGTYQERKSLLLLAGVELNAGEYLQLQRQQLRLRPNQGACHRKQQTSGIDDLVELCKYYQIPTYDAVGLWS